ncbi:MAG: HD domain-containing protein [Desulfovibrio sp.]|nr:HD domain-containing protein [Desulfovibrio sp.]
MEIYLVGGAVRDLLLGKVPHDLDYAFLGDAANFKHLYPKAKQVSKSHPTFILKGAEYTEVEGHCLESDLARRDLTINALALDSQGRLIMHQKALADLKQKILRPASETAILDDPLRVYRLARFQAQWPEYSVAEEALGQIKKLPKAKLAQLAPERVGNELRKAMLSPRPDLFFSFLAETDCLKPWFAELELAGTITAGPPPWHHESVLEHSLELMRQVAGDELAVWMALCHDLGKITTPKDLLPHHYGHEQRGKALVEVMVKRLRLPTSYLKAGRLICLEHMRGGRLLTLRIGTRRDLVWTVGNSGLADHFWKVVDADSNSQLSAEAKHELAILKEVKLPLNFQNQGLRSQERLRELQCQALIMKGVKPEKSKTKRAQS